MRWDIWKHSPGDFKPESNEKLSENGVLADKTMNTLLHVFEAYTELYRVSGDEKSAQTPSVDHECVR